MSGRAVLLWMCMVHFCCPFDVPTAVLMTAFQLASTQMSSLLSCELNNAGYVNDEVTGVNPDERDPFAWITRVDFNDEAQRLSEDALRVHYSELNDAAFAVNSPGSARPQSTCSTARGTRGGQTDSAMDRVEACPSQLTKNCSDSIYSKYSRENECGAS